MSSMLGPVTLGHFLALGAMLFALSVIGIFLNRKNLIVLLMAPSWRHRPWNRRR